MDLLDSLINRLTKFENDIPSIIKGVIEENEHVITEMNTDDQLFTKGINSMGISIDTYRPYKPLTMQIKSEKGQPVDRVTLRDTGSFHHSFYIEAGLESFMIKASDPKTLALMVKYGDEILGLTKEHTLRISHEMIKPKLISKLRNGN